MCCTLSSLSSPLYESLEYRFDFRKIDQISHFSCPRYFFFFSKTTHLSFRISSLVVKLWKSGRTVTLNSYFPLLNYHLITFSVTYLPHIYHSLASYNISNGCIATSLHYRTNYLLKTNISAILSIFSLLFDYGISSFLADKEAWIPRKSSKLLSGTIQTKSVNAFEDCEERGDSAWNRKRIRQRNRQSNDRTRVALGYRHFLAFLIPLIITYYFFSFFIVFFSSLEE